MYMITEQFLEMLTSQAAHRSVTMALYVMTLSFLAVLAFTGALVYMATHDYQGPPTSMTRLKRLVALEWMAVFGLAVALSLLVGHILNERNASTNSRSLGVKMRPILHSNLIVPGLPEFHAGYIGNFRSKSITTRGPCLFIHPRWPTHCQFMNHPPTYRAPLGRSQSPSPRPNRGPRTQPA